MGIGVLGPLVVDGVAAISPRDRVVLGVLVVRRGEYVTPDVLADALWGAAPPASAAKVVQGCVSRLRRLLGAGTIETTPQGYRLAVTGDELDVSLFERQLRTARQHLADGDPDRASYVVGQALTLWRGAPLADLEEWPPGQAEGERLRELRLDAEELEVAAAVDRGHAGDVVERARLMVGQARYRERRWELWALALYRADRQRDALAVLQRARRTLREDLGLEPGPALVRLQEQVLRHDPDLAGQEEVVTVSACPYRGLLPYEAEDAASFFGREADLAACLALLRRERRLVVAGPSGCGKSSLVRAGVVASLRTDREPVVLTRPGAHPLDSWPVLGSGRHPTVVVDQAEEVLTLCTDAAERAAYLACLVAYDGPLVLAWRADRLGELTADPRLARMVERGLHLLAALDAPGLRDVVEQPAAQAGLRLEPGLTELLVRDVEGEPGALPLLSHVLAQTWEEREGRTLTVAGYRRTGGVRDALARSAEGLYADLDPQHRGWLRGMALRLVALADDGSVSCTKVPRGVLAADTDHDRLVERLVHARLLSSDGEDVQLAHEALAREWPRLRNWLAEDTTGQRLLRHLSGAASGWEGLGRPESELYRGPRLAAAREWAAEREPELTRVEREFLEASELLADREARSAGEQLRRQRRDNRRLRGALLGAVGLLLLAVVAGQLALRQAHRAREEATSAQRAATSADARRLGLLAADEPELSAALLLAMEARRLEDNPQTRDQLSDVLTREPHLQATFPVTGVVDVSLAPGGGTLAVARGDDAPGLMLLDPVTGEVRAQSQYRFAAVRHLDRGTLMAGAEDPVTVQPVSLLDASTLAEEPRQLGGQPPNGRVVRLTASGDGRWVAAQVAVLDPLGRTLDAHLLVWDRRHPAAPVLSLSDPRAPGLLELTPNGRHLFVAWAGTRRVLDYDVRTGRLLRKGDVGGEGGLGDQSGRLSPDGRMLALTLGHEVVLLDPTDLRVLRRWRAADGRPRDPNFSPDSRRLVTDTSEGDGGTTVWNPADGRVLDSVGGGGAVERADAALAADDRTLYSTDTHGVRRWDLELAGGLLTGRPSESLGRASRWHEPSPDRRLVAHLGVDGSHPGQGLLQVQDVATGRVVNTTRVPGAGTISPWWSPDGRNIVLPTTSALVDVDLVSGRRHTGPLPSARIVDGTYAGDGSRLIAVDQFGDLHLVDPVTLEEIGGVEGLGIERAAPAPTTPYVIGMAGYADPLLVDTRNDRTQVLTMGIGENITILDAALTRDASRAAVTTTMGVGLFDVRADRWISRPAGRAERVWYSPDERWYATTLGNEATVYDARDGSYVSSIRVGSSSGSTLSVVFGDQEGHLVVVGDTGDLQDWVFDPGRWTRLACRLAGRSATRAEWSAVMGDRPYHETCPGSAS